MQRKTHWPEKRTAAVYFACAAVLFVAGFLAFRYFHLKRQKVYTIGVLYNSVNLSNEDRRVIQFMINKRVAEINETGGLAGRKLQVKYLDDKGSRKTVYKVVKESIRDESLIAYLGCWSSTRVQAVSEMVGKMGVPFIGGYSVTSIAGKYPNMFSYEIGIDQNAFVLHRLLKNKAGKVAFVGNTADIYTVALLQELKKYSGQDSAYKLVMETWHANATRFTTRELNKLTDSLITKGADFLVISVNARQANQILRALAQKDQFIPTFSAFSDIPEIDPAIPGYRNMELYDISVFGIPSGLNLRQQLYQEKNNLSLKHDKKMEFRLGLGGLHADAIGMIKEAAELKNPKSDGSIREKITNGLQQYINGERVYHGWFSDWYFSEDRALVSEVLLGWKPAGMENVILAPFQFLRSDSALQEAQVLFTNIDMVQIDQVNDEEGTFNARFYISFSSLQRISMPGIDFSNAVRNEENHKPILAVKLIKADSVTGTVTNYNYLYRISGKFFFHPDLREYPFDKQQFPISIQTNSAFRPFLIQPPGPNKRDTVFTSTGWLYEQNFVGFDQELIASNNKFIKAKRHIPYYKFNFTYVLKRAKVDFFLKTLTPLLAILIITYFSVFIPIREFEALTAIQVTALLSSIALYFSAYKPQGQFATTSDKIFIFTYVMVTTLIGASILQYWLYSKRTGKRELAIIVSVYERILFPIIVIGYTFIFVL